MLGLTRDDDRVSPFLLLCGEQYEHPAVYTAIRRENFHQSFSPSLPAHLQLRYVLQSQPTGRVLTRRSSLGWRKRRSCRIENHSGILNCPRRVYPSYSRKLPLLPFVLQPRSDSSSLFLIKVRYCC